MNKMLFVLFCVWISLPLSAEKICYEEYDSIRVESLLKDARTLSIETNRVLFFARSLMNTPYKAGTLEHESKELLMINLRELDCMTFVETVLALTVADRDKRCCFTDFVRAMKKMRYRRGVIDGYCSRLHYFTEWVKYNSSDNTLLVEVTEQLANPVTMAEPDIHFMSSHPELYPHLKNNEGNIQKMKEVERMIALFGKIPLIEKDRKDLLKILEKIEEGNIIALTSTIDGLDVSHLGFAVRKKGEIYLLHASSRYKKVTEEPVSLREYMKSQSKISGIRVLKVFF